jgi:hypothetical protein
VALRGIPSNYEARMCRKKKDDWVPKVKVLLAEEIDCWKLYRLKTTLLFKALLLDLLKLSASVHGPYSSAVSDFHDNRTHGPKTHPSGREEVPIREASTKLSYPRIIV